MTTTGETGREGSETMTTCAACGGAVGAPDDRLHRDPVTQRVDRYHAACTR